MLKTLFGQGSKLGLISLVEVGVPLLRMIVFSRLLTLHELGLAAAIAATIATFELVSDIAAFRYVATVPRSEYHEALAGAHALSIARGSLVSAAAVMLSPLIAAGLSASETWESFAWGGAAILIRSFEHFGPRVAERDFRYGAQLAVWGIGGALGLIAAILVAIYTRDHRALIASLFAQSLGMTVTSHFVADSSYRLRWRSRYFRDGFKFGFPLMVNGAGLAVSQQADRFIVASMLGLPALGIYNVLSLASLLPITMLSRFFGTLSFAIFRNLANQDEAQEKIVVFSRVAIAIATTYGAFIVLFLDSVVVGLFGDKFAASDLTVAAIAAAAFLRLVRGEPFSSYLLNAQRTSGLAAINLSSITSFFFMPIFIILNPVVAGAFSARAAGEVVAVCTALTVTMGFNKSAGSMGLRMAFGFSVVAALSYTVQLTGRNYLHFASFLALICLSAGLIFSILLHTKDLKLPRALKQALSKLGSNR